MITLPDMLLFGRWAENRRGSLQISSSKYRSATSEDDSATRNFDFRGATHFNKFWKVGVIFGSAPVSNHSIPEFTSALREVSFIDRLTLAYSDVQ